MASRIKWVSIKEPAIRMEYCPIMHSGSIVQDRNRLYVSTVAYLSKLIQFVPKNKPLIWSLSIGSQSGQTKKNPIVDPVNFSKTGGYSLELNAASMIASDCRGVLANHGD